MVWYGGVVFVTAFLSLAAAVNFLSGPSNTVVPVGGTARLKCVADLRTVRGTVTLYWYKAQDGGGYYITGGSDIYSRNLGAERYSLETSSVNGEYSYTLKITSVEAVDSGQYQCMGVDSSGHTRSPRGSLSVVQAATDEPLTCSFYPQSPTVGQTVTFSCIAPRGIAPEMLSWWMAHSVRIQPSAHLSNNHGISFVKTLSNADNFAEFTCLVGSSFDTTNNMNCSVTPLAVPIRAEVTAETAFVVADRTATFRCRGTAIPPVTRYRWIYGSGRNTIKISTSRGRYTVINNGDSSTLTIAGITMQDNGQTVRCVVLNEVTKTIGSSTLRVTNRIQTTQKTTILTSSSTSPMYSTVLTETPTASLDPSQPTTSVRVTGDILVSTNQQIHTTNDHGDVINIVGCKDCGGKISPQQNPGDEEKSSNSTLAVALGILAICALVAGIIAYIVYTKRGRTSGRVIKRKWKNKPLQRLRSLRQSVSSSNQDVVNPNSVRLKTIEVIVNQPPPEWQLRVKDVAGEEKEPREQDLPKLGNDQSPVIQVTPDCALPENCDALYAKPDKMKKKRRHHGDEDGNDPRPVTASPTVPGQYLTADADDCFSDGVSDASTWDMSSVDSGCEEEMDEIRQDATAYAELDLTVAAERSKECTPPTETVEYANTTVTKTSLPRS
ncbi:uncharacterized protein LOC110978904 [Acanthaster planci]|uniref:Uncharacterized protein LOC110978904 n=1 Tax=Acanthaster planci TaxID=133434 RepID=A0A8B7YC29_ACAPL|nr:uncharacterized protein LOC110978904 [Acanthaster planci]